MENTNIILDLAGALGGAAVIIFGLSAWIGKVWATRIAASENASYSQELAALNSALDISKHDNVRNSDARFELYSSLWNELQDLKTAGDRLWERASRENVMEFTEALKSAQHASNRGRLILKEKHYQKLNKIFKSFDNYRIGKIRLIEIRNTEEFEEHFGYDSEDHIRNQIRQNRGNKERYEELLTDIVTNFREQLALNA